MKMNVFCEKMGFDRQTGDMLEPVREIAQALADGKPEFFDFDGMTHYCRKGGMAPEVLTELAAVNAEVNRVPELRLYAEMALYGLMSQKIPAGRLPYPTRLLKERDGLFFLLTTLAAFPIAETSYRKLGIPLRYLEDFALFFPGGISMYAAGHGGRPGFTPAQFSWMRNFALARKLRIGRLDYIPAPVLDYVPAVFRSRKTNELAVLCREGWQLDEAGYRIQADGEETHLEFRNGTVTGTPVSPLGYALTGTTRTLDLTEYESVLNPYECVPACHMAGGGGMTPEKVIASFREARDFFKIYFHQEIKMITCISWLLNPEWEREMPESNIVRFQRMTYLTPGMNQSNSGLFFVFGTDEEAWEGFAGDTSLRRAFLHLHERHGGLRNGAMFVMADDLDRLHEGLYRNQYTQEKR